MRPALRELSGWGLHILPDNKCFPFCSQYLKKTFFNFKIIIDSQEVAKIKQVVPYTYHSAFPSILHNVLHYQKQETDIGTKHLTKPIQLTRLWTLLKCHPLCMHSSACAHMHACMCTHAQSSIKSFMRPRVFFFNLNTFRFIYSCEKKDRSCVSHFLLLMSSKLIA